MILNGDSPIREVAVTMETRIPAKELTSDHPLLSSIANDITDFPNTLTQLTYT